VPHIPSQQVKKKSINVVLAIFGTNLLNLFFSPQMLVIVYQHHNLKVTSEKIGRNYQIWICEKKKTREKK
jgi:hypothetical protein